MTTATDDYRTAESAVLADIVAHLDAQTEVSSDRRGPIGFGTTSGASATHLMVSYRQKVIAGTNTLLDYLAAGLAVLTADDIDVKEALADPNRRAVLEFTATQVAAAAVILAARIKNGELDK